MLCPFILCVKSVCLTFGKIFSYFASENLKYIYSLIVQKISQEPFLAASMPYRTVSISTKFSFSTHPFIDDYFQTKIHL